MYIFPDTLLSPFVWLASKFFPVSNKMLLTLGSLTWHPSKMSGVSLFTSLITISIILHYDCWHNSLPRAGWCLLLIADYLHQIVVPDMQTHLFVERINKTPSIKYYSVQGLVLTHLCSLIYLIHSWRRSNYYPHFIDDKNKSQRN